MRPESNVRARPYDVGIWPVMKARTLAGQVEHEGQQILLGLTLPADGLVPGLRTYGTEFRFLAAS